MAKAAASRKPPAPSKKAKRARLRSASASVDSQEIDEGSAFEDTETSSEDEESSDAIDDSTGSSSDDPVPSKRKKTSSPTKSSPVSAGKSTKVFDLVKAPKHYAPPGQLSTTTLDFLRGLAAENEREWLQRHDAPYRHALTEWKAFVDVLSTELSKVDWTLPILPAKDLVHRLARDIRFSNDKTPYKINFQASFSRTGRKGPYAGYFMLLQPGGKSFLGGGKWGVEKNELATIRTNLLRRPRRLRDVIGAPEFVKLFGKPEPAGKGKRQNIFGREDELKNAPKLDGVDKTHKDIDLLKLKSFVVSKTFTDADMLSEDAVQRIGKVAVVMAPLIQLLNDWIMPQSDASESGSEDDDEDADDDEEEAQEGSESG